MRRRRVERGVARASAHRVAAPDDPETGEQLEAAEQLHYLALWELRRARRALARRDAFDTFVARLTLDLLPWR